MEQTMDCSILGCDHNAAYDHKEMIDIARHYPHRVTWYGALADGVTVECQYGPTCCSHPFYWDEEHQRWDQADFFAYQIRCDKRANLLNEVLMIRGRAIIARDEVQRRRRPPV